MHLEFPTVSTNSFNFTNSDKHQSSFLYIRCKFHWQIKAAVLNHTLQQVTELQAAAGPVLTVSASLPAELVDYSVMTAPLGSASRNIIDHNTASITTAQTTRP